MYQQGTPRMEITSVYPFILRIFELRFGGTVRERDVGSPRSIYRWRISGDGAINCMNKLYPYLVEKQVQVSLILKLRDTKPGPLRDGMMAQMRALKIFNYEH